MKCHNIKIYCTEFREPKNPLYINKMLRPYAKANGIRAEPIVKGIALKRPVRLDQFTYT